MMPFSSKSCWCLKANICPSLSFLTKTKDERSKSYHCFATWKKRGRGGLRTKYFHWCVCDERFQCDLTIFSKYCSRDSTVASGSIFNMRPVRSIRAVSPGARSRRNRSLLVKIWNAQTHSISSCKHTKEHSSPETTPWPKYASTYLQVVRGSRTVIQV